MEYPYFYSDVGIYKKPVGIAIGNSKEDCKTSKRPVKYRLSLHGSFPYVVVFCLIVGGNLLSHTLPGAVPSARAGLASGFGMGNRAFPCRYRHRQIIGTNMF